MSKLTASDFENVLDLIEAVYATPNVPGVGPRPPGGPLRCGYSVSNIIASFRRRFPQSGLSDSDIDNLLMRGSRQGVFNVYCSNAVALDFAQCEDTSASASEPLYHVNQNMVRRNPANKVYADAFNAPPVQSSTNDVLVDGFPIESRLACATNAAVGGSGAPIGQLN